VIVKGRSQHNCRFWLAITLIGALGAGSACDRRPPDGGVLPPTDAEVEEGTLVQRFLLTGAFEAVDSADVFVPQTNEWQLQLQWMIPDGSVVAEGETVVEFDNSSFAANLDQQRTAVQRSERTLLQTRASGEARMREAEAAVERARIALAKAEIDASVPESIRSRYDHQTYRLAAVKARANYEKALADLKSTTKSVEADNLVGEEERRKSRRELAAAETALEALVLKAPRDGLVVVEDHPWEDRKFQVGDTLYPDWVVLGIPDLERLRVRASLSDVDDGSLEVGMPVTCIPDIAPELALDGLIERITPIAREQRVFSERRGFDVTIGIVSSLHDTLLVPGMSVRVEAERRLEPSLLVPRAAIDFSGAEPRARLRSGGWSKIKLGPCSASRCVLLDGLERRTRLSVLPGGGS